MDKNMINNAVAECYRQALKAGWWDNELNMDVDVPKRLMLIVSEVAEAMEAHRKGLSDDHLPNREGVEVELADAVIRIFDLAGGMALDLGGAMVDKLEYNKTREDHKREVRQGEFGKKY